MPPLFMPRHPWFAWHPVETQTFSPSEGSSVCRIAWLRWVIRYEACIARNGVLYQTAWVYEEIGE